MAPCCASELKYLNSDAYLHVFSFCSLSLSVSISLCVSLSLPLCLCLPGPVSLFLSVSMYLCLSLYAPVFLSPWTCLAVSLFLSVSMYLCLSLCPCLSVSLDLSPRPSLSVHLSYTHILFSTPLYFLYNHIYLNSVFFVGDMDN